MLYDISQGQVKQVLAALRTHAEEGAKADLRTDLAELCVDAIEYFDTPLGRNKTVWESRPYFSSVLKELFVEIFFASQELTVTSQSDKIYYLSLCFHALFLEMALDFPWVTIQERFINFYTSNASSLPPQFLTRCEITRVQIAAYKNVARAEEANSDVTTTGNRFVAQLETMVATISGWDKNLEGWSKRASDLQKDIEKAAGELNFIGLSKAFSGMMDAKSNEKRWQVGMMGAIALILIGLPFGPMLLARYLGVTSLWSIEWIPYAIPFVVLELLFLYFFRIFVNNFYSVKAQFLQLQLRYHLCAFVEGYAEFAAKSKKGNEDKLFEKFETLIFSPLSTDPNYVPSQFDGIEHLVKLFKDTKASS